jgi:hypothetical protein
MGWHTSILTDYCQVLVAFCDQAKHNSSGKVEENGALRHRKVELCPVGALAMHFFAVYHIQGKAPPNFAPDFNDATAGELGRRDWWHVYVFPGRDEEQMTYASECATSCLCNFILIILNIPDHRDRANKSKKANGHSYSKVTHAGRGYAAKKSREYGADSSDTHALGHWKSGANDSTVYRVYDSVLPMDSMLAVAMFNARKRENYVLVRDYLCE